MRVVIDTNVFVSSFFGGKPRRVIDLWKKGSLTLCLSKAIIEEYVAVLRRLGVADEPELRDLLDLLVRSPDTDFIVEPACPPVVTGDPADDKFFGCAAALGADAIVTGDKAMLAVGESDGTIVMTPDGMLRRLGLG